MARSIQKRIPLALWERLETLATHLGFSSPLYLVEMTTAPFWKAYQAEKAIADAAEAAKTKADLRNRVMVPAQQYPIPANPYSE